MHVPYPLRQIPRIGRWSGLRSFSGATPHGGWQMDPGWGPLDPRECALGRGAHQLAPGPLRVDAPSLEPRPCFAVVFAAQIQ